MLKPGQSNSYNQSHCHAQQRNQPAFQHEYTPNQRIRSAERFQCGGVFLFLYHEHAQRAENVEGHNQHHEGQDCPDGGFFGPYHTVEGLMLTVTVLHLEVRSQICSQMSLELAALQTRKTVREPQLHGGNFFGLAAKQRAQNLYRQYKQFFVGLGVYAQNTSYEE